MNPSDDRFVEDDSEAEDQDGYQVEETDIDSDELRDGDVDAGGAAEISRRNE